MPSTTSDWVLITVTYNSADALRSFWSEPLPDGVRWLVVDNASSDDSVAVAKGLGATVIALPENVGFSGANNRGYDATSEEFVAFVNPDVKVDFSTLRRMKEQVSQCVCLVAPQLTNCDGTLQPNGRGVPTPWSKIGGRLRPRFESAYLRPNHTDRLLPVEWVMGAAICGRRSVFASLGRPWDDRFFVYYEDADICLRAWRAGIPVYVDGRTHWTHGWARDTASLKMPAWRHELRSALRFYSHYPALLLGKRLASMRYRWLGAATLTASSVGTDIGTVDREDKA